MLLLLYRQLLVGMAGGTESTQEKKAGISVDQRFEQAQTFMWTHARLLERHLFAYLFANGSRDAVLAALRPYQNADGGFGSALEPDIRAPVSQPVPVEMALKILDLVDAFDDPMLARACDYLAAITTEEGGVPLVLPSVNAYPRASWWQGEDPPVASLNPTAGIAGLLYKHGVVHPWLDAATRYCWDAIAATDTTQYHDLMPILTFLEYVSDRRRADQELARIAARVCTPGAVTLETHAEGYVKGPLDWAPMPTSYCRQLFSDDTIAAHLEALAARQQLDGGW